MHALVARLPFRRSRHFAKALFGSTHTTTKSRTFEGWPTNDCCTTPHSHSNGVIPNPAWNRNGSLVALHRGAGHYVGHTAFRPACEATEMSPDASYSFPPALPPERGDLKAYSGVLGLYGPEASGPRGGGRQ